MYTVTPTPAEPANPDPAPATAQRSGPVPELLRAFRMRRKIAIAAAAFVLIALIAFGFSRGPQYQATSLIYIQPIITKTITDASGGTYDPNRYDTYVQQQVLTFARPDILSKTLDLLSPRSRALLPANRELAIASLKTLLKVERLLGGYQISISMTGSEPAGITEIVNAVTSVYLKNGQKDDLAQSNDQLQALVEERQQIQNQLDTDRRQQAGLSSALGIADTAPADTGNRYDTQLADLRAQLAVAHNAHQVAEAQLASVLARPGQPSNTLSAAADSLTRSDAELAAMKAGIATRRSALSSQMAGLTPSNPLLKQDQDEIAQLDKSLQELTTKLNHQAGQSLKGQLTLEAARTRDVEARLSADLARQTGIATGNTPKLQRAADLAASILRLQTRFTEVDAAVHSIAMTQGAAGLAHLSLTATQPTLPLPSKKPLIFLLALPVALCFGLFVAVFVQKLDPRIYVGEDITSLLNFPPMAVLPDLAEVSPRVLEEFVFRLVAGIDQAYRTRDAKTFVFTAVTKDISIKPLLESLAAEMKMLGYRVVNMTASGTLSARSSEDGGTHPWQPAASLIPVSRDIIIQPRQDSFVVENLERLKQNVDLLFIEALPLRSSSEAEFVARHGDVTVLIAQSGHTTRHELRNALTLVRRLNVRGVVSVLTNLLVANADADFIESIRYAKENESNMRTTTEKPSARPGNNKWKSKSFTDTERPVDTDEPIASSYKD
ncbi:MAG: hypothetical protein ABI197_06840 [Granulicella sp.]